MIIKELSKEYTKIEKKLHSINNYLYNNPELGYEEIKSSRDFALLLINRKGTLSYIALKLNNN